MTFRDGDVLDVLLRAAYPDVAPTDAERAVARSVLGGRIASGRASRSRTARRMLAAAAVLAVAFGVLLFIPRLSDPVRATLLEIAEAAERVSLSAAPGEYAYTSSESIDLRVTSIEVDGDEKEVLYFLPKERESWISDLGITRISETVGRPIFVDRADEPLYNASVLPEIDRVGETYTDTYESATTMAGEREWPTDPDELEAIARSLPGAINEHFVVAFGLKLLQESTADAELRAAALRMLAHQDILELDESGPDTFRFSSSPEEDVLFTVRFEVTADGQLLSREEIVARPFEGLPGLESGTIVSRATYSRTSIVFDLGDRP